MERRLGLIAVGSLLLMAGVAAGQETVVTGTVVDTTDAVLPGATIEALRGNRVSATATTGADGRYQLVLSTAGTFRLRATLEGFATEVITFDTTARATQDFQLTIARLNDSVVVTASRTAESRATVTESLSVFTSDDIEALGSSSLADVVATVPGLHIASTGREGSIASLFTRGGESDYNQVLIDGVRVNTSGGAFSFSRVAASEIERVEIVRGAQSALYGSDAIGSVIQIFTKRGSPGEAPRVLGSFEGGSFGTARTDIRVLGGHGIGSTTRLGRRTGEATAHSKTV